MFCVVIKQNKHKPLPRLSHSTGDYPCVSESDFWYLVERVITEYEKGVLALNNRSVSTNWDVISSAYFATTVLTTIGKGRGSQWPIQGLKKEGCAYVKFH